ncbi:hypothetical protein FN846DRAFT_1013367 [Sphaerosporella brunnea]|uniref:Uncharacterized protein n=1 Tax=Sphaerosporella brunnea TaxID=1250544 RepID=A0A5J5EXP5_9PEZI|nr:hypothetical protein FN846DRAFT_1013367 [Sphaerosporella brunnea]
MGWSWDLYGPEKLKEVSISMDVTTIKFYLHQSSVAVTRAAASRDRWTSKALHLGRSKGVYDAELFGIAIGFELALKNLTSSNGIVRLFTVAQAAFRRLKGERADNGVPGHKEVLGDDLADELAKNAAYDSSKALPPHEASVTALARLARCITEAKTFDREAWHCTLKNSGIPLSAETRRSSDGPYLLKTDCRTDDKCWWCDKGAVQTRELLFKQEVEK